METTIQTIKDMINTINGVDWEIIPATVGCDEYLQVTREADGAIMELGIIPDEDETFIGYTTYADAEYQAEGAYIEEGAVTAAEVQSMVENWAS